jgi:hypothetical protein
MSSIKGEIFFAGVFVAIGLALGGWWIGLGFEQGRQGDRYVTVKGLAERYVEADLAIWPLRFAATGNDLAAVQADIDRDTAAIRAFFRANGLPAEAVRPIRLEVIDLLAQPYRPEGAGDSRFIITQTLVVRSDEVGLVQDLTQRMGEIVRQGVVLQETGGPAFVFTGLNAIKPEMLAEATASARSAAAQFAADADSTLAGIRRANQGVFQILPRDEAAGIAEPSQVEKKVRIVTTIEYRLED